MFALLLPAAAPAADKKDRFDGVEIRTQPLGGVLWAVYGLHGVIGASVGDDGILLVDDQYARLSERIRAALARLSDKPVHFVVNTHWHPDHTGGNANFAAAGATIFSHHNVRTRLMNEQQVHGRKVPPAPEAAWPVVTFADGLSFHFNGEEVRVLHLPRGHTDGDAVVHFTGSDVIHAGDLWWRGQFPFVDQGSGGNVFGFLDNVQQVIDMAGPDTRIIAGHGEAGDRQALRAWHARLSAAVAAVRAAHAKGMDQEGMLAAGVLAEFKDLATGFIPVGRFIGFVLADL